MEKVKDSLLEKFQESKLEIEQAQEVFGGAWDTRAVSVLDDENGSKVYRDDSSTGAVQHWESDRPRY